MTKKNAKGVIYYHQWILVEENLIFESPPHAGGYKEMEMQNSQSCCRAISVEMHCDYDHHNDHCDYSRWCCQLTMMASLLLFFRCCYSSFFIDFWWGPPLLSFIRLKMGVLAMFVSLCSTRQVIVRWVQHNIWIVDVLGSMGLGLVGTGGRAPSISISKSTIPRERGRGVSLPIANCHQHQLQN